MDIEKLEKLNELKEKGILTQEEFDQQKKELLSDNKHTTSASKKEKPSNKKSNDEGLSLWGYFISCIGEKYACFKGRARRKEYFGFLLGFTVIDTLLGILIFAITNNLDAVYMVRGVLNLLVLLPSLGVLVRRLHDVNCSGWWVITLIVPLIAIFFKSDMETNKYGEVPAGMVK